MKGAFIMLGILVMASILIFSGCSQSSTTPKSSAPAAAVPPAATSPVAAGKTIELRVAHFSGPGGVDETAVFKPYFKQIEDATQGRVKFSWFGGGVIAQQPDSFDAAASGLADISWVVCSSIPGRFRLTNLSAMPLMSEPLGEGRGAAALDIYQKFPEVQAEFAGTHVLYLQDNVSDYVLGTKKPIRTLDDLKGLKVRVSPGPPTSVFKALGSSPMYCDSTAIYENMQKGVMDAWTIAWSGAGTFRLQELTKYVLNGGPNGELFAGGQCMLMNQKVWDSLPPDIQAVFNKFSGITGAQFVYDAYVSARAPVKDSFVKAGVPIERLSPAEFQKWNAIAQDTWKEIVNDLQSKGLPAQAVFNEVQQFRAKYAK